jgi:hypothetical protein
VERLVAEGPGSGLELLEDLVAEPLALRAWVDSHPGDLCAAHVGSA